MSKLIIPKGYRPQLGRYETEQAIKNIKDFFQLNLSTGLHLHRVTGPLFVQTGLGLNDDLNGVERPVTFPIKDMDDSKAEVVHSLAKWKRLSLAELRTPVNYGIYTDMNAIRADEELDNIHSLYVDQWDWERVIDKDQRKVSFLKKTVKNIYYAILRTEFLVCEQFPQLHASLPEKVFFIHSEDLLSLYPDLTPEERETEICRKHRAVFIIGIGAPLSNGKPHGKRAPDYDDWSTIAENGQQGLNGDLLIWHDTLDCALEISSMGIRVNKEALLRQLKFAGEEDRVNLYYHQNLLNNKLPLSIGGGIGQSRLCMLLLKNAHIGEIQSAIWPADMMQKCKEGNIPLII